MLLKKLSRAIAFFILSSCSPKIEFTATPPVIAKGDSVYLNWKIKGEPTLLFNQRKIPHPPNDSLDILEFTLSVQKNGKTKYIKRQVSVVPHESRDRVVLATSDVINDTLIAEGIKDTITWKTFEIFTVSSVLNRPLIVTHSGATSFIEKPGTPSSTWSGKEYGGYWRIMSPLTIAEKQDRSKIPNTLEIEAVIHPSKN